MAPTPAGVLVIEDEILIGDYFVSLLEEHGLPVVGHALTGREARGLFDQKQPTVLVCDIKLGAENGVDLAQELSSRSAVKIVFVSGGADAISLDRAGRMANATLLAKPVRGGALVAAVRAALAPAI
jgi:DNA-binding response OmpR family regulator